MRSTLFAPGLLVGLALLLQGCQASLPAGGAPASGREPAEASPPAGTAPIPGDSPGAVLPLAGPPTVGQLAPDFALTDLAGQPVRLSDLRGKPVVVNFFATWCGACKAELPAFQSAYEQHRDQGLQVLLVDLRESPADVRSFATTLGLTMPIVVDEQGTVAAANYRLVSLPATFFVDPTGLIRGAQSGKVTAAMLKENVDGLLGGAPAAAPPSLVPSSRASEPTLALPSPGPEQPARLEASQSPAATAVASAPSTTSGLIPPDDPHLKAPRKDLPAATAPARAAPPSAKPPAAPVKNAGTTKLPSQAQPKATPVAITCNC